MKAGKETEMYNQGYMDGFDDAVKSEIEKVKPKLKDVKEKSFPKDEPDYWTSLEHQYAGMAMHAILTHYGNAKVNGDYCAEEAKYYAHALVEKLKEKEEKKTKEK